MSYKINTTDGRLLVDLLDGKIDNSTTDLFLIGKNVSGFGEYLNENFIRITENFANSAPPSNPLTGQVWYDTSENRLKVFDGTIFRPTDTTTIGASEPAMLAGDLWIDTANRQLYFSDGLGKILAGPIYNVSQGETGFNVETVNDISGNAKTIARLMIGSSPVAILTKEEFTPSTPITGFTGTLKAGFNISSLYPSFKFHGETETALSLVDINGVQYTPNDFIKSTTDNTLNGTLYVKNNNGIRFGNNGNHLLKATSTSVYAQNTILNNNYAIQVVNSGGTVDAISINAANSRVGIFRSNPAYTLDVNGDLRVAGSLTIEGSSTALQVVNLQVEDKNIELAFSGTLLSDSQLDGAGVTVRSSTTDKTLTWDLATSSWKSSEHFSIPVGKVFKIGSATVLSETTLASTVTSATGITRVGTLLTLDVDNINLNNATITTTSFPLTITSAGNIVITNNRQITGVGTPTSASAVATKNYVDTTVNSKIISFGLDITGLNNTQIGLIINDVNPANFSTTGTIARVATFYYSGASVVRGVKQYTVVGGAWTFDQDLISSV